MSNIVDLRAALETRLNGITSPLTTQWENTTIIPDPAAAYQIVTLVPADPLNPEMNGPLFIERGYMQVDLRYPIGGGTGPKAAMTRAQAVRDRFPRGLSLVSNAVTVTIDRTPTIGLGSVDGDRYNVPVKIRYFSNNAS